MVQFADEIAETAKNMAATADEMATIAKKNQEGAQLLLQSSNKEVGEAEALLKDNPSIITKMSPCNQAATAHVSPDKADTGMAFVNERSNIDNSIDKINVYESGCPGIHGTIHMKGRPIKKMKLGGWPNGTI